MFRPKIWAIAAMLLATLLVVSAFAQNGEETGETAEEAAPESAEAEEAEGGEESAEPEAKPPADKMDKGTYTVRLRDLEDRVNRLKEQIFRSKARLSRSLRGLPCSWQPES